MIYWFLMHGLQLILDLFELSRRSDHEKDAEILLLRYQLRLATRDLKRGPALPLWHKLPLAVLANWLLRMARGARHTLARDALLFTPDTLLSWHRTLVRRKWTYKPKRKPGRPRKDPDLEALVVQMKRENPRWGYDKIEGELLKLGFAIDWSTARNILVRHGLVPTPEPRRSSWCSFLNHYRDQFLACDFFTVETLWLKTLYVLFFIEHGSRRVYLAGCTDHPTSPWVTQQARQLTWQLEGRDPPIRFLIHDHDGKFTDAFDTVFVAEAVEIIHTPFQAPNANAIAERWIRSVRDECLNHLIILNARHLRHVLREYVRYYNEARPHQGLEQAMPIPLARPASDGAVHCRDVLGGIVHDYYREAA